MNIKYETGCSKLILNKEALIDEIFILSNGILGEVLQKFENYDIKLAVYGDFSKYKSKPLKDFIYESNNGKSFFFVSTESEAIRCLNSIE